MNTVDIFLQLNQKKSLKIDLLCNFCNCRDHNTFHFAANINIIIKLSQSVEQQDSSLDQSQNFMTSDTGLMSLTSVRQIKTQTFSF